MEAVLPDTIRISLTDFVDFAISTGTPKLTKVAQVMARGEYSPATDFWKPLRHGICEFHRGGKHDKKILDKAVADLSDAKKVSRYGDCVRGYKKCLGNKSVTWFDPPTGLWTHARLSIKINPELGLILDGSPVVAKLYFKAEPLSKRRIDVVTLLLSRALAGNVRTGTEFGIIDVQRGRLFSAPAGDVRLLPLLMGEAASFKTIWDSLSAT